MSVQSEGLVCQVRARVVKRTVLGKQTYGKTNASHTTAVLLLRLQEVDGRQVDNARAYIYYNKSISKLNLVDGDALTFEGAARSGADGYHFVRLKNIQVNRGDTVDGVRGTKVVGILPRGMSLREYLDSAEGGK